MKRKFYSWTIAESCLPNYIQGVSKMTSSVQLFLRTLPWGVPPPITQPPPLFGVVVFYGCHSAMVALQLKNQNLPGLVWRCIMVVLALWFLYTKWSVFVFIFIYLNQI